MVLVVNVASECGFTPQYKQLAELYDKYRNQGLVILGAPCNQFGAPFVVWLVCLFVCLKTRPLSRT